MGRKRRVLYIRDLGTIGDVLQRKADAMSERSGEKVSMASVARRLLAAALSSDTVRRRAGVP